MADIAWTTTFPSSAIDTTTQMPTVSAGDKVNATHVVALRDAVIALEGRPTISEVETTRTRASAQLISAGLSTWTDLTGLTIPFSTVRSNQPVEVSVLGVVRSSAGASWPHVRLLLDGTPVHMWADYIDTGTAAVSCAFIHRMVVAAAGSHVVHLEGSYYSVSAWYLEPVPIDNSRSGDGDFGWKMQLMVH